MFDSALKPHLAIHTDASGVRVLVPHVPRGSSEADVVRAQQQMLDDYIEANVSQEYATWYYTPMALQFSGHLAPEVIVYDCMDELSGFLGAPPELIQQEQRLFSKADVVFAGGASLYASKRTQHKNVHLFPSSIDYRHFAAARETQADPADQAGIPHPRIGFYGVIDERLDRVLLSEIAELHPDWQFVLVGPVVKVREEDLPHAPNLHYLGHKTYAELPAYLGNWDVAMLPFARNASTKFISPTKTPEYLAGGKPVVSTPIRDVIRPYGELKLVKIGADAQEFCDAIEACLNGQGADWLATVDAFLANNSWDTTFMGMLEQVQRCLEPHATKFASVDATV